LLPAPSRLQFCQRRFLASGYSTYPAVSLPIRAATALAYDAIGVRLTELPVTPERVLKALEEKRGEG